MAACRHIDIHPKRPQDGHGGPNRLQTKQKIRDSEADKKVLCDWVEVRGLPERMGKMEVREVLNSVSAIGMKDITLREGQWRIEFDDAVQSEFFCNMVDNKVKCKGTVLKVRPWICWYGVDQIWDQLEKYANLERQKSQDASGLGTKISAVGEKGCAVCCFLGKEGRAATHSTADLRSQNHSVQNGRKGKSPQELPAGWSTRC